MERSWILLGMMGAGKSSVGRSVAALSGREFVDTDILLQHRFGRPVGQIFDIYGEVAFREHEHSILRGLAPGPAIVATGGGIVLREDNWTELRRLGITVWLKAGPETIIQRLELSKKRRPLLEREDWRVHTEHLIRSREAFYERADIVVSVDGEDLESAPAAVIKAIAEFETR
jgi:shikimate kinase